MSGLRLFIFISIYPYFVISNVLFALQRTLATLRQELRGVTERAYSEARSESNYINEWKLKPLFVQSKYATVGILSYEVGRGHDLEKVVLQAIQNQKEKKVAKNKQFAAKKFGEYTQMCKNHHIKIADLDIRRD